MDNWDKYMPDFLIIGAGKSGTTSLNNYLKQHPQLYISPRKEPNFFAYENFDVSGAGEALQRHYEASVRNLNDYKDLFKGAREDQLKGETSNTYLVVEGAAENIKRHLPSVKLIAILRNPVDRLYSRFLHLARENKLPGGDFADVLDRSSIWWERNDLVKEGFYHKNLSRFFELFPKSNIKIFLTEDLEKDPNKVLGEIYEFLQVEPHYNLDYSVKYNKSGFIKNKLYDNVLGHNSMIKKAIKKITPRGLYENLKNTKWIYSIVNNLRDRNLRKPKLDSELRCKILNEIYSEDMQKLQSLIDRDLSKWINPN